MTTANHRPTADELRPWLIERVAEYTERAPDTIATSAPLSDFGLESVYALALCGDIEDHLGIRLEPTLIWDYPTVDALVSYLTVPAEPAVAGPLSGQP